MSKEDQSAFQLKVVQRSKSGNDGMLNTIERKKFTKLLRTKLFNDGIEIANFVINRKYPDYLPESGELFRWGEAAVSELSADVGKHREPRYDDEEDPGRQHEHELADLERAAEEAMLSRIRSTTPSSHGAQAAGDGAGGAGSSSGTATTGTGLSERDRGPVGHGQEEEEGEVDPLIDALDNLDLSREEANPRVSNRHKHYLAGQNADRGPTQATITRRESISTTVPATVAQMTSISPASQIGTITIEFNDGSKVTMTNPPRALTVMEYRAAAIRAESNFYNNKMARATLVMMKMLHPDTIRGLELFTTTWERAFECGRADILYRIITEYCICVSAGTKGKRAEYSANIDTWLKELDTKFFPSMGDVYEQFVRDFHDKVETVEDMGWDSGQHKKFLVVKFIAAMKGETHFATKIEIYETADQRLEDLTLDQVVRLFRRWNEDIYLNTPTQAASATRKSTRASASRGYASDWERDEEEEESRVSASTMRRVGQSSGGRGRDRSAEPRGRDDRRKTNGGQRDNSWDMRSNSRDKKRSGSKRNSNVDDQYCIYCREYSHYTNRCTRMSNKERLLLQQQAEFMCRGRDRSRGRSTSREPSKSRSASASRRRHSKPSHHTRRPTTGKFGGDSRGGDSRGGDSRARGSSRGSRSGGEDTDGSEYY